MSHTDISLAEVRSTITEGQPLVVSYTNSVTVSDVANATLHWGGLPVMSEDRREAQDLMAMAGATLINMGTVNEASEERMITAGRAATRASVPVTFDPVGVGASETRTRVAERIIDEVGLAIVKGNYGEISALAGEDAEVRGVESIGEYAEIGETAIACARKTGAVVVASGETDIVATDEHAFEVSGGHPRMGSFVGSGCLLGVTLATTVGALGADNALDAAIAGTLLFGLAGEQAAADEPKGPASYKQAFLDTIAGLSPTSVESIDVANRVTKITSDDAK